MLATPGALPVGPEWLFEVMWDGMRVVAEVADGSRVRLTTRGGRDVTAGFPELAGLRAIAPDVVLDGEVVLLEHGVPSFAALAERMHGPVPAAVAAAHPVAYMAFDVLRLYGVELLDRPLDERRATLERLEIAEPVAVSPAYADGAALLAATEQQGMEGVVAKRRADPYRPGERSPGWVTVAHRSTQACVVGGWLYAGGRISALLLGLPARSGLRYIGKVDIGLTSDAAQRALELRLVPATAAPFGEPLPRTDATGARWCAPSAVVDVSHQGFTADGRLRRSIYRGVRDDLEPTDLG